LIKLPSWVIGPGNLLTWIKYFLTDRQQCTRVGDVVSDTGKTICGVNIRHSCLGLFLSIALTRCVCCSQMISRKSDADTANLQNSLDRITDIGQLNVRCQFLSRNVPWSFAAIKHAITTIPYYLRDSCLEPTDVVKDLGQARCHNAIYSSPDMLTAL